MKLLRCSEPRKLVSNCEPTLISNIGRIFAGHWCTPEADVFKELALRKGVPEENIIIENKSTNSGENVLFSYKILKEMELIPKSIILVQKPYMLRRTYATFMKQWPGDDLDALKVMTTCQPIEWQDYPNKDTGSADDVIKIMLQDLEKIDAYPAKGFQIHQDIPDDVWTAYDKLCKFVNKY